MGWAFLGVCFVRLVYLFVCVKSTVQVGADCDDGIGDDVTVLRALFCLFGGSHTRPRLPLASASRFLQRDATSTATTGVGTPCDISFCEWCSDLFDNFPPVFLFAWVVGRRFVFD